MNRVVGNYADEMLLFGGLLCAALAAAHLWHRWHPQRRAGSRATALALALVSLGPFLYVTLSQGYGIGRQVSLVPLQEILTAARYPSVAMSSVMLVNMGGNIVLLVLFGVLSAFALRSQHWVLLKVATAAAALSLMVEAAQYTLALGRIASADDVLLNALGAFIGAWASSHWWGSKSPQLAEASQTESADLDTARK